MFDYFKFLLCDYGMVVYKILKEIKISWLMWDL